MVNTFSRVPHDETKKGQGVMHIDWGTVSHKCSHAYTHTSAHVSTHTYAPHTHIHAHT